MKSNLFKHWYPFCELLIWVLFWAYMPILYWGCSLREERVQGKDEWGHKVGRAKVRRVYTSWPQLCSTEARGSYCSTAAPGGEKEEPLTAGSFLSLSGCDPRGVTSTTPQGWESVPSQVDKKSWSEEEEEEEEGEGGEEEEEEEEEKGKGSPSGDRGPAFSRRRKGQPFFFSSHMKCLLFFKPGTDDYTTNNSI